MKCMSCEMEINPKWKHAIDINICPFCGQGIMEEHLKNLFTTLRETMDKLQEYPSQLNDWMLSNHNYIKTDSELLPNFLPKEYVKEIVKAEEEKDFQERKNNKFTVTVKTDAGEEEVVAEKIQTDEKTNEFFKRAEAIKPNLDGFQSATEKNEHLKKMVQQIKRSGSTSIDEEGGISSISPEMMENADPEAVAEYMSVMSGNESIASSLPDSGDEEIPSVVLSMANRAAAKGGNANSADLMKLQKMHDKVAESRRNFESGGKGGFSRSS